MNKEIRVYILDPNELEVSYEELTDEEFMGEAENRGTIHTLASFQEAFNDGDIFCSTEIIRIIEVETFSIDIETMGLDGKSDITIK